MDLPGNPIEDEFLEMMSDLWSTKQVDRNRLCSFLGYLFENAHLFRPIGLIKTNLDRGISTAYFLSLTMFQNTPIVQTENATDDETFFTHKIVEFARVERQIFFNSKAFEIQDFDGLVDSFYK